MGKREKEKERSLDALAKIAYSAGSAPPPPAKPIAPPRPAPAPAKRAPPAAPPKALTEAEIARRKKLAERQEKLEEEKRLRERRERELARNARIDMSRIDPFNIPSSIRRTGFDRQEATVSQKIQDVLGDARVKEGREKARDKGRRQGGRA